MPELSIDQAFQLALLHHQAGRTADAEPIYRQILQLQPGHADALHLLGLISLNAGRAPDALDLIQQAIGLQPNLALYHNSLGQVQELLGQTEAAEAAYGRALQLDPNYSEAHNNMGNLQLKQAHLVPAISSYQTALGLNPNFATAHTNLGNAYLQQGELDSAILCLRRAVALNRNVPSYHCNLGNALAKQQDLLPAIECYQAALRLDPNDATAHNNLGTVYKDQGEPDQAISCYRRALELQPGAAAIHSNLLFATLGHPGFSSETITAEHVRWAERYAKPLRTLIRTHSNDRRPERKLRIGYVSPDFRDHAVARFLLPLLEHHQRDAHELYGYATVRRSDAITERIKGLLDAWRPISALTDPQAVDLIRQDQIDILVDLAGHTRNNRLLIFAHKPAPVQVTWLGYPAATGLDTIDYRLTDALADPAGSSERRVGEQIFRLPHCAWCYQPRDTPNFAARPPERPLTFGSFNNFAKIMPPMLRLWAQILGATPGSQLLLKTSLVLGDRIQDRVREIFREARVDPSRVLFWGPENERGAYLGLFSLVDIVLDAFPYHGTTTTCEALWMGRPVVCLVGQSHVSRVGLSLLTNVGRPELAARTEADYVRIATALGQDRPRLATLHKTLQAQMEASPLMDAPRFAADVESAFRTMWHTWCRRPGE